MQYRIISSLILSLKIEKLYIFGRLVPYGPAGIHWCKSDTFCFSNYRRILSFFLWKIENLFLFFFHYSVITHGARTNGEFYNNLWKKKSQWACIMPRAFVSLQWLHEILFFSLIHPYSSCSYIVCFWVFLGFKIILNINQPIIIDIHSIKWNERKWVNIYFWEQIINSCDDFFLVDVGCLHDMPQ